MSERDERSPSETVPFRTVQIIAGALIVGPLIFAVIAFLSGQGQQPGDPTIGYIAILFSVIALFASFFLPTKVAKQNSASLGSQGTDLSMMQLFGVFNTQVIIRAALLEGGAFFCCVAYMSSRLWWTLAMALGLLSVIAIFFPTRGRFDDWVREQRELRAFDGPPDAPGVM
jgi:hypothetical protein